MDGGTTTVVRAGYWLLAASVVCAFGGGSPRTAGGQSPSAESAQSPSLEPIAEPDAGEAPQARFLEWAKKQAEAIDRTVAGYKATLVLRERVDGELLEPEVSQIKIRHRPFSIYAHVVAPESRKGDEAIYVEGKNEGKLLVHTTGIAGKLFGTLALDPAGSLATDGRRHPITAVGILNLCRQFVEAGEADARHGAGRMKVLRGAQVGGRPATLIELVHPDRQESFPYHRIRIFADDELKLPVRFERYDWPKQPDAPGELLEEYTYRDLELNPGLTDADFDPKNPAYAFP